MISFNLFFFILLSAAKIESVTLLGSYDTPGIAYSVTVVDDIAYVADSLSGLQIVDVSDPSNPTLITSYNTLDVARVVNIVDNIAYVADGHTGLVIVDVSDPSNPTLITSYTTPGFAWGVSLVNDIAYVADYESGLQIISVTNPFNPISISYCDTPDYAIGVTIDENIAYIVAGYNGLQIINVTNSSNPILIGNYNTPGSANGVAVVNDIAYIADEISGLVIINVTNPSYPTLIGNYNTPDEAFGVSVDDDIAYVADRDSGLQIINVTNPSSPTLIGNYTTPGSAHGITVVNDIAYVADGLSGLLILKVRYYTPSDSFTISMIAITSFSIIMIIIFIIIKSKLLWFYGVNYDIFYLLFPLLGIINVITDILFIIFLSLIRYHYLYLIISSSIFILSIILNYIRTSKIFKSLIKAQKNNDMIQYLSKNQKVFDDIINLSVIHPAILLILKSNWKQKDCYRLPICGAYISIPIQCLFYDIFSLIPQSIIICFIAIEDTPLEWNILLWIIVIFSLLNLIIAFSRIFTILYYGGEKSKIKPKALKYGVFKTVKDNQPPSLLSTTESSIEMDEYNTLSSSSLERSNDSFAISDP